MLEVSVTLLPNGNNHVVVHGEYMGKVRYFDEGEYAHTVTEKHRTDLIRLCQNAIRALENKEEESGGHDD